MVPVLARMAVIIKAEHDTNIITGNYEMAYICGLLCKLNGKNEADSTSALEMHQTALSICENCETEDPREQNLIRMLKLYKPDEVFDEQVKELFAMGLQENNLWEKM